MYFIGLTQSEKTFLMSTPKRPGVQIYRRLPLRYTPHNQCVQWEPTQNCHNSFTLHPALHYIQLYMLSFGVELLDRSVIHLFITSENALLSVNFQLLFLLCFWLHIVVVVVYYTTTTNTAITTTRIGPMRMKRFI